MTNTLTALRVTGLFGRLNHDIKLRDEPSLTILTGLNGTGKTHTLRLLDAIAGLDLLRLAPLPFAQVNAVYEDGRQLEVTRDDAALEEATKLQIVGRGPAGRKVGSTLLEVAGEEESTDEPRLPPWIEAMGGNRYYDARVGRVLSREAILRRYRVDVVPFPDRLLEAEPWLKVYQGSSRPTLIEAGRLDLTPADLREAVRGRHDPHGQPVEVPKRITQYVERISSEIAEARRESFMVSQQADRRFAARALSRARARVKEDELRERYERIAALHHELHRNSLTEETIGVEFPAEQMNTTERRIINIFLDDWEKKLAPLLPIHGKLQLLREIVAGKMTDKDLIIGRRGDLSFAYPDTGEAISVEMLSSGEQHLLALYTMLLFSTAEGALVLIDEPEISLHAAWKHEFLNDMERISEVAGLRVVLATHSSAIINGRWDLVEQLTFE